jgi:DNA-binding XRE family transcriptional regulator
MVEMWPDDEEKRNRGRAVKAQKMKAARMLKGMTQYDLAQLVGCTEALVSKIETGRAVPKYELKQRIARVLEIETWEVGA